MCIAYFFAAYKAVEHDGHVMPGSEDQYWCYWVEVKRCEIADIIRR